MKRKCSICREEFESDNISEKLIKEYNILACPMCRYILSVTGKIINRQNLKEL